MMINRIHAFFNPEQFQGWGKSKRYFEGWYFKVINKDASKAFAFIPGIAIDSSGIGHSFIQVLDGKAKKAQYHKFNFESFRPTPKKFSIHIGENYFSEHQILLNLPELHGELQLSGNIPWPKPIYAPGIMGPFSFVPFMECYHGIVSMDHVISGKLSIQDEVVDFEGGRGYIEKDWGRSFPSAYVWMQTNHFSTPGISLKASVANIPWLGSSFVGFISGLWLYDRLFRFNTYNGTTLKKLSISTTTIELILQSRSYELSILAHRDQATSLASPIMGLMDGRIEESMSSVLDVQLHDKRNRSLIFSGKGHHAGLEVAGDIDRIRK